jgi:hypothetical protein
MRQIGDLGCRLQCQLRNWGISKLAVFRRRVGSAAQKLGDWFVVKISSTAVG